VPEHTVICVVDDDLSVRRALARLIASCGLRVETYASASEYLESPHTDGVACLIVDVHLARTNGFDLLARLAATVGAPPAIVITAHDDAATRERASASGASAYLRKPFESAALLAAVGHAIGRVIESAEPG
jgi:FixJ family two-component response regulator